MKRSPYLKSLFIVLTLTLSSEINALPMPPVPLEPIYFEPPIVEPSTEILNQSCIDLDNAVRYLQPYKYTYKPNFHDDGYNKVATAAITFDSIPLLEGVLGLAYLGYSALVEEKEQRRILLVEQKISMLQQVKAEKHCFE